MDEAIHAAISEHFNRCNAAIEEACERALQGGKFGVLVIRHPNGDMEVGVDPGVPYGCIYERDA